MGGIFYFWNNFVLEFCNHIRIISRLGEVTLGDFKSLLDPPGQYRYYFKALDAEFGTIREEV